MTCSLPVLEYAKELHTNEDKTYRALALSNLIASTENRNRAPLCLRGAVSAGAAAGAGIAYLCGGGYEEVTILLSTHSRSYPVWSVTEQKLPVQPKSQLP